jgi:hypothetical protein
VELAIGKGLQSGVVSYTVRDVFRDSLVKWLNRATGKPLPIRNTVYKFAPTTMLKHQLTKQPDCAWLKKGVSLLGLASLLNGSVPAGTAAPTSLAGQSITIGEKFTLHSGILNEDRPYWVYLPPSYQDTTFAPKRYPVLFLLDGDNHFLNASGMVQYMSGDDDSENIQIPELIVVAIPNAGHRVRDFTPSHSLKVFGGRENPYFASSGGADAFLKFVKEELVPQIDAHYRTVPYRILMGHSLGGLFVVHAFLEQPSLFQAYLAIDPAVWWDDQLLAQKARKVLPQETWLHDSFYLCTVNHADVKVLGWEPDKWDTALEEFAALLKTNASPQLRSKFQRFDLEDHASVPIMGLYEGLRFTFDGYEPSALTANNPASLNAHFDELSQRLGFKVLPPEQYVDDEGYTSLVLSTNMDQVIAYFKLNAMNYPNSFHAYDSLAAAYATKGDKKSALENYKKSLELNPKDQNAAEQLKKLEPVAN